MSNVWFITGTSRGFGRVWAEAALKRIAIWEQWNGLSGRDHGADQPGKLAETPVEVS